MTPARIKELRALNERAELAFGWEGSDHRDFALEATKALPELLDEVERLRNALEERAEGRRDW